MLHGKAQIRNIFFTGSRRCRPALRASSGADLGEIGQFEAERGPEGRERGRSARQLPSATLTATPIPAGEAAHIKPSAPAFASHSGWARISSVSVAPSPPISTGMARIAAAMRAPPSSRSSLENAEAARSSVRPKQTTPQPSRPVATSLVSRLGRRSDLVEQRELKRVVGPPVALDRPAVGAADGDHARVLAGAVVEDRLGRAAVLEPAVELVLASTRRGQQPPHDLDVLGGAEVRRRRDSQLVLAQVLVRAREGQRLQRLRGGAQRGDERRVAGLRHDGAVPDGHGMHLVDALDDLPTPHGYPERLTHGRERKCLSYRR